MFFWERGEMMVFRFAEEVKQLTKELVKCPSIVGTQGEKELARRIAEKIRQMPYFRDNPHLVKLAPTRSDDRERFNVLA
jgi:arginine utilization protein RocB